MRYAVIGFCLAVACLTVVRPGHTQVHVSIGINLPGPPQWVVVPGLPVYYAPGAPANVFQYNGQCYAFVSGGWYVGPGYNGPWIAVGPSYVPAPLLRVPVRYYHEAPERWREGHPEKRPRWEHEYGREWDRHREGWRGRREHDDEQD